MSKPRINFNLKIDTTAHANTLKTNIENRLSGMDFFENEGVKLSSGESKNILFFEARLNKRIERDELKDWIIDQIQNHPQVKNWILPGSKIVVHFCSHDDLTIKDCKTTEYEEFIR